MLIKSTLFIALFKATLASQTTAGTCVKYPTNATCSNYVDYSVYLPNSTTLRFTESNLSSYRKLGHHIKQTSPYCFDLYSRYICSKTYPRCLQPNIPCISNCKEIRTECANVFKQIGQTHLLPNCTLESTTCTFPPTKMSIEKAKSDRLNTLAASSRFIITDCPSPFVKDTLAGTGDGETLNKMYCRFGCCVPCPAQNIFYKKGWAEKGFAVSNALRFVSAVLSFILMVSYLILPDKRRHPSLLILNLSISIFIFSMTSFFAIVNPTRLQCASNGVSPAEMGNNALCAAQGAILVFGSFATTMWCCALILSLHVHTVWKSTFFLNKYILINIICWGVPTLITCIAIGLHALKFEIASLCLISMKYIFNLFFYPLAAIIIPSFLVHIATFFCIANMAIHENLQSDTSRHISSNGNIQGVNHRHIVAAVKIQWRALMLAIAAIVTILFYWLTYMTQMNRIDKISFDEGFVSTWIQCMTTSGNDQNTCYEQVKSSLPSFPLMLSADILAGLIGLWLFVLFGKNSLWREWNDLIYNARLWLSGQRAEKNGDQFFTL